MKKTLLILGLLCSISPYIWGQSESVQSSFSDLVAYNSTSLSYDAGNEAETDNAGFALDYNLLEGQGDAIAISFYPNPVKDVLSVKFKDRGNYTIRIYNIVGEKIREKSVLDEFIVKFDDLASLPNGMYFISYEPQYGRAITKTFSKGQ